MPSLNSRQFHQPELDRFYGAEVVPHGLKGRLPGPPRDDAPRHDPGPATKRGVVGEGQTMLNFDYPTRPLETAQAGLVPVDSQNDPAWDRSAWRYGGAQREVARMNPEPSTPDGEFSHVVAKGWKNAPVETIGPDAEIRTNQMQPGAPALPTHPGIAPSVSDIEEDHVETLRGEGDLAFMDPETSEEEFPWVAEVEGKRYLLEGHHRAIAARTRDSGEFPAHVLRGGNWGQIEEQLYDGPRTL